MKNDKNRYCRKRNGGFTRVAGSRICPNQDAARSSPRQRCSSALHLDGFKSYSALTKNKREAIASLLFLVRVFITDLKKRKVAITKSVIATRTGTGSDIGFNEKLSNTNGFRNQKTVLIPISK